MVAMQDFRVSNDAIDDAPELRRRIADEGYLFFRGLMDVDKMLSLRRDMLSVLREGGWLVDGTQLMDGIADVSRCCTEPDIEYATLYHEVYKLQSFHRAGHWPQVLEMMEKVIGEPIISHPRKIARMWFPKYTDHTTPIHQDFVHFQGTYQSYTCWAPVGDCPIELGGLAVLPGSHKVDRVLDHHFSLGAGSLAIDAGELEGQWHSTNYDVGDALIFPALTAHQALPNLTEDRLRISLDNRYQPLSHPIAEHMLDPHLDGVHMVTWQEVYEDWPDSDLQYYWKELDLKVLPLDTHWVEAGFRESLARAKTGDSRARHALTRIVKRDPDSEQGKLAAAALVTGDA